MIALLTQAISIKVQDISEQASTRQSIVIHQTKDVPGQRTALKGLHDYNHTIELRALSWL